MSASLRIPSYYEAKVVSRSDIYKQEDDVQYGEEEGDLEEQLELLKQLVSSAIEVPEVAVAAGSRKRRRKMKKEDPVPILFHLVSGRNIQLVSLERPPLPPAVLKIIEPEDDEETARRRHEVALVTAVDGSWVVQQSAIPDCRKSRVVEYKVPNLSDSTFLMLSTPQPLRATRPPGVPHDDLKHPYAVTPQEPTPTTKCCPTVELTTSASGRPRRPRRRSKHIERPQPTFWRPPASIKGKCMGYGYGYSSSFAGGDMCKKLRLD